MATEDDTIIQTAEKDFLIYKGKQIENIRSFILEFKQKGFSSLEFLEDMRENAKLPLYANLEDLVIVYREV
jgi:hypothetical protein